MKLERVYTPESIDKLVDAAIMFLPCLVSVACVKAYCVQCDNIVAWKIIQKLLIVAILSKHAAIMDNYSGYSAPNRSAMFTDNLIQFEVIASFYVTPSYDSRH